MTPPGRPPRLTPRLTRLTRLTVAGTLALASLALAAPLASTAGAATQPSTWNFTQARVPGAQAAGRDGDGVLVAVIDTYVDGSHGDFGGRVLPGLSCSGGTCTAGQRPDGCAHGTHTAGTVASTTYGVAPRARVLPVQVLYASGSNDSNGDNDNCGGSPADVAAGIRAAVAAGASVLNLSLGSKVPGLGPSSDVTDAVADAARAGVVVVFAAGNSSVPVTDSYGADALIVAATGPSGSLASYSQSGSGVALAAPGGDPSLFVGCRDSTCVRSLYPRSRTALLAGTSMAAPHVAGIAALLIAEDPSRGRDDVVSVLRRTARPLSGAGSGLVDATAALAQRPQAPPPPASGGTGDPSGETSGGTGESSGSGGSAASGPGSGSGFGPTTTGSSNQRPAPGFASCGRRLTAKAGTRVQVKCRTSPSTKGAAVLLQQPDGKGGWRTVSRVRTAPDGSFRAFSQRLDRPTKLRLVLGKRTHTVTVALRR